MLIKLFTILFLLVGSHHVTSSDTPTPMPGSLMGKFNIPSINNMVDLFGAVLPQYEINGFTFPVKFSKEGWLYSVNIDSVLIDSLTINKRSIKFLPNSNTLRFDFREIDIKAVINSEIYVLWIFPIKLSDFTVKGISFEMELAPEALSSITEWYFKHEQNVGFSDFSLTTKNPLINGGQRLFHNVLLTKANT